MVALSILDSSIVQMCGCGAGRRDAFQRAEIFAAVTAILTAVPFPDFSLVNRWLCRVIYRVTNVIYPVLLCAPLDKAWKLMKSIMTSKNAVACQILKTIREFAKSQKT